jgi:hypothetical protein
MGPWESLGHDGEVLMNGIERLPLRTIPRIQQPIKWRQTSLDTGQQHSDPGLTACTTVRNRFLDDTQVSTTDSESKSSLDQGVFL